jgi:hypothetical protein
MAVEKLASFGFVPLMFIYYQSLTDMTCLFFDFCTRFSPLTITFSQRLCSLCLPQ